MKNIVTTLAVIVLIVTNLLVMRAQETKAKEEKKVDGKTIFMNKKCTSCHSIEAVGIIKKSSSASPKGPPDLSTVGTEHDAAWITKWLHKEETLHGKKHLLKFSGSDEELKILTEWLASLKPDSSKGNPKK